MVPPGISSIGLRRVIPYSFDAKMAWLARFAGARWAHGATVRSSCGAGPARCGRAAQRAQFQGLVKTEEFPEPVLGEGGGEVSSQGAGCRIFGLARGFATTRNPVAWFELNASIDTTFGA